MPRGTPMVCQWVPMGSVMGYPWGIGITKRFPNTRSIRMFPDTRSLGIFRHIPQQLVFPNNWYFRKGNTKYPGYSYIQAHTPTIGISNKEIPRGIRIFRHIPQQLVFPRATKYPQYSDIQAHTPTICISEEIPNTRSILIFRQIPKQLVFPRGNTKYPQYSYIQA